MLSAANEIPVGGAWLRRVSPRRHIIIHDLLPRTNWSAVTLSLPFSLMSDPNLDQESSTTSPNEIETYRTQAAAALNRIVELEVALAAKSSSPTPDASAELLSISDILLARFKPAFNYDFRFAGNKDRYTVQYTVLSQLLATLDGSDLQTVLQGVQNAVSTVADDLKNILLADDKDNPFGWALIHEYRKTPLATDAQDAKEIRQAHKKLEERRAQTTKKRPPPYDRFPQTQPLLHKCSTGNVQCWGCYEYGHKRDECPGKRTASSSRSNRFSNRFA